MKLFPANGCAVLTHLRTHHNLTMSHFGHVMTLFVTSSSDCWSNELD